MAPATAVNAEYKEICKFSKVSISLPSANDKFAKIIDEHQIELPNGSTITVPRHIRRGYFVGKELVTVNYFVNPETSPATKILADITVVEKNDHHREKTSLVLDVRLSSSEDKRADYVLKMGGPNNGNTENNFLVPGTNEYLRFSEIPRN